MRKKLHLQPLTSGSHRSALLLAMLTLAALVLPQRGWGQESSSGITGMSASILGNNQYQLSVRATYNPNDGETVCYTVNGGEEQTYSEAGGNTTFEKPCTIIAYVKTSDGTKLGQKTMKLLAFSQYAGTVVIGQEAQLPAWAPALEDGQQVSATYTTYNSNISVDESTGAITVSKVGLASIQAGGFSTESADFFVSSNDTANYQLTVLPPAPVLSLATGSYDEEQTLTMTSDYVTSNPETASIKYYLGDSQPETIPTYSEAITISETTTIHAWVEAHDDSGASYQSEEVTAQITIRQSPNLQYTDPSVSTYEVVVTEATASYGLYFNQPELKNPLEVPVSYSSSNTSVATIDDDGYVEITGLGQTTITATSTANEDEYLPSSASYTLTVTAGDMSDMAVIMFGTIEEPIETYSATYTGAAITPEIVVWGNDVALVEGTDYEVAYTNNVNVGTPNDQNPPTITVTFKGNYTGSVSETFTIIPANLDDVSIEHIADQAYTGEAIEPTVTVKLGDVTIGAEQYSVAYSDNVNAGVATVTVTLTSGNFTTNDAALTKTARFCILPPAPTINYDATASYLNTDKVSITMPESMADNQDASIRYSWVEDCAPGDATEYDNETMVPLNAGTNTLYAWVRVGITGADPVFSERVSQQFVVKTDIANAYIPEFTATATYTGQTITPEFQVMESEKTQTAISAENYTVSYLKIGEQTEDVDAIVDAGTYGITIIGTGDTYGGSKIVTREFTVTPADLSAVTIDDIADQTYTGEAIEPTVTVKLGDVTIGAEQYSVAYTDNVNVGVATVTLTSTGKNFVAEGTKTATFQIAAATAIITAQAEQTATYDTKAHEIVATVEKGTIAVAYYATADDRTEGSNVLEVLPVNAGTYFARISQTDANYTSEPVDVTLTILPAEITAVTLAETTLRYTGEEQTVQVDAVVAGTLTLTADDYDVTGLTATDKGTHTVTVTGKGNFTGTATATFTIVNRLLEGVTFAADWASYFNADEDIDLPEGIAAYVVTGVGETSATLTQLSLIPAATPVLLHQGDEATTENTLADGNMMRHADEAVEVAAVGGTVYGLYEGALMRVATGTIPAGRNYLLVAATASPAPRLGLKTDSDIATGISTAVQTAADGDRWYTLDGQPLQQKPARRGIYIKNGQKVYIYNK